MERNIIEQVNAFVAEMREKHGNDIVTLPVIDSERGVVSYTIMPGDVAGYTMETRLSDGATRHCGNSSGSFFTEWKLPEYTGVDPEPLELE